MDVSRFHAGAVSLAVYEIGQGQPFVFQHGLCGDASQPANVFPLNTEYRCITVECRGHGTSDTGSFDDYSIETFASDIDGFIGSQGLDKPVIGGISMGAAIALRLAVRYPGRFKALVLARPAWLAKDNPPNNAPNLLSGKLLGEFEPVEAERMFMASALAQRLSAEGPDNLKSIRGFFHREPVASTSQLLQRIASGGPQVSEAQIRELSLPVLVIGNGLDYVHPVAYARALAGWIPHAKLVEITSKAVSPERYTSEFRAALAAFLKEL